MIQERNIRVRRSVILAYCGLWIGVGVAAMLGGIWIAATARTGDPSGRATIGWGITGIGLLRILVSAYQLRTFLRRR